MEKDNIKKLANSIFISSINKMSYIIRKIDVLLDKLVSKTSNIGENVTNNLKVRIISGSVMLVVAVLALCVFKGLFYFLVIAITILMVYEWIDLTKNSDAKSKWRLIGFFYIAIPMVSILKLRDIDSDILLWMFTVIAATDVFAYFSGKSFGGPKLMPNISPNKTWYGLLGGVVASMIIGLLSSFMFSGGVLFFIFISAILSIIEQASDLLESRIKRFFGVKDSGKIIPGHGGILDRFDGITLVAPSTLLIVWIFSESFIGK